MIIDSATVFALLADEEVTGWLFWGSPGDNNREWQKTVGKAKYGNTLAD